MSVTSLKTTSDHIEDDPYYEERVDLAAAFRMAARHNMHEAVANHFSLAVSDDGVIRGSATSVGDFCEDAGSIIFRRTIIWLSYTKSLCHNTFTSPIRPRSSVSVGAEMGRI